MSEAYLDQAKWLQEGKTKAPKLRASAKDAAKELFSIGDIREFLDLLSRLSYYDAYNLILILQQFPKAKFLAGYNVWKRLLGEQPGTVLRPEWVGKGIDLVIPFTETQKDNKRKLIWFATRQFDILQTKVKYDLPPSVYVQDELHVELLVQSLCGTISTEYHRSVFHKGSDATMKAAGLPGEITENTVSIRDDLKPYSKLEWLLDCLCVLHGGENNLPKQNKDLFRQCIKYAFWKTWALERPPTLYAYQNQIRAFPEELQMDFLDQLCRTYRFLEESIVATYVSYRKEMKPITFLSQLDEEIWNTDMMPPG